MGCDIVKPIAFLALAAILVVAAAGTAIVAISAFSRPAGVPSVVDIPGNDTNGTGTTDAGNVTDVTPTPTPTPAPTPEPHKPRIVCGADATPVPGSPTQGPDTGVTQIDGKAARHIAYAYQSGVSGIADFTAYWTVPQAPEYRGIQNHTIFLWTGIQQGDSGLIQAVLEWDHDHTGRYWTLACWIVNKRDGTHDVSPRVWDVYPGDRIRAEMRYEDDADNPGCKVWHIIMTDETHGGTIELFDRGHAVDTNDNVIVFSGVLEGIGYVYDDIDLPRSVTFTNMTYYDEHGKVMPVYLSGYADPKFPHVAVEYEDREWATPVTIHTGYTRP